MVVDGLGGEIIKQDFGSVGGVAHEVGTLRMERTKGKYVDQHGRQPGVVNENLRFLGHQRLYACDLSVFPYFSRGESYAYLGRISDPARRSPPQQTDH